MHIVVFEDGMIPRILHNVDHTKYDHSKILVNPVLPRGIPPHRWKKGKGCIEVLPEEVVVMEAKASSFPPIHIPPALKSPSMLLHHALAALVSALISLIIHRMIH